MWMASIGFGILSWRDRASLENALKSYQAQNLLSLFNQTHIFFAEQTDEDHELAQRFGVPSSGADENLGILGGFEALASRFDTDYILLVENDCPLIENYVEAKAQIEASLRLLERGEVQVVRMRSLSKPGECFNAVNKYHRMHGNNRAAFMRRLLRPKKARSLVGIAPYVDEDPCGKFPHLVFNTGERSDNGPIYRVRTKYLNWTNQSIMIKREFFLERIIGYAKTHRTKRRVNGFRNLEIELNSRYWRDNKWYVGMPRGLFTHQRVGERGY